MNIKPLADRVLILPAPAEEKTIGGIIIPDTAKEKPLHPEEAVPHILAYFQQEFSNPFPAPKPVSHEEELLLEQIDSAFDGVILEDGIGLMTTELIDMYAPRETCDAIGPCEERTDWRRITPSMIRACRDALVFTDPKGYRFLLPAWLTLDLRGQLETCDAMDYLPLVPENCGDYESRAILLNDPQLEAVMNYIEYRQKKDGCPFSTDFRCPEDGCSR